MEWLMRKWRYMFAPRTECPLCHTMLKMYRWEDVQKELRLK